MRKLYCQICKAQYRTGNNFIRCCDTLQQFRRGKLTGYLLELHDVGKDITRYLEIIGDKNTDTTTIQVTYSDIINTKDGVEYINAVESDYTLSYAEPSVALERALNGL
jgi:hypothetical protein